MSRRNVNSLVKIVGGEVKDYTNSEDKRHGIVPHGSIEVTRPLYDKIETTIGLDHLITLTKDGKLCTFIGEKLKNNFGIITNKQSEGNFRLTTGYYSKGEHLLTLMVYPKANRAKFVTYGSNTQSMMKWVGKHFGDLKVKRYDVCMDYVGTRSFNYLKYNMLRLHKKVDNNKGHNFIDIHWDDHSLGTAGCSHRLKNKNSKHSLLIYEKGKKFKKDLLCLDKNVNTSGKASTVGDIWSRGELQFKPSNGVSIDNLPNDPLDVWLKTTHLGDDLLDVWAYDLYGYAKTKLGNYIDVVATKQGKRWYFLHSRNELIRDYYSKIYNMKHQLVSQTLTTNYLLFP